MFLKRAISTIATARRNSHAIAVDKIYPFEKFNFLGVDSYLLNCNSKKACMIVKIINSLDLNYP